MGREVGKDVELVPVGVGTPAVLAFREQKGDALNLFDAQYATLETQGTAIRRLPMPQKYLDLVSNGLVAHADSIKNDPRLLVRFGRALAKTTVFCEATRAACVKAFWQVHPNQKPTGGDEATNLSTRSRS
jgi:NitT/TauT family transport system substrate-binding protein